MIYTKVDALISLKPNAQFSWAGTEIYSELNYLSSDTPPTEAELDTEVTRLNNLEPMRLLRKERNIRLAATDWRASSDLTLSDAWKHIVKVCVIYQLVHRQHSILMVL